MLSICGKPVGPGNPTFVIAEAGINHNGDLALARRLVREAKDTGADAVKFQTLTAFDLMTHAAGSAAHLDAGAGREDVYSFVVRIALDREAHEALWEESGSAGISFISSVFSTDAVDMLEAIGVEAYKIASMDIDNLPLLDYVARTGKPMVISTGMADLAEVERALDVVGRAGNSEIVLLHCASRYPTEPAEANLRAMETLRVAFGTPVGFSDHTEGNDVAIAAAALGADVIEKHFTVDRSLPGPDQALSADTAQLSRLIASVRDVERALGDGVKRPVSGEIEMRAAFRRSIVSAVEIPAGAIVTREMLAFKRPGDGISPADLDWVVGRTVREAIAADTVIRSEHLV